MLGLFDCLAPRGQLSPSQQRLPKLSALSLLALLVLVSCVSSLPTAQVSVKLVVDEARLAMGTYPIWDGKCDTCAVDYCILNTTMTYLALIPDAAKECHISLNGRSTVPSTLTLDAKYVLSGLYFHQQDYSYWNQTTILLGSPVKWGAEPGVSVTLEGSIRMFYFADLIESNFLVTPPVSFYGITINASVELEMTESANKRSHLLLRSDTSTNSTLNSSTNLATTTVANTDVLRSSAAAFKFGIYAVNCTIHPIYSEERRNSVFFVQDSAAAIVYAAEVSFELDRVIFVGVKRTMDYILWSNLTLPTRITTIDSTAPVDSLVLSYFIYAPISTQTDIAMSGTTIYIDCDAFLYANASLMSFSLTASTLEAPFQRAIISYPAGIVPSVHVSIYDSVVAGFDLAKSSIVLSNAVLRNVFYVKSAPTTALQVLGPSSIVYAPVGLSAVPGSFVTVCFQLSSTSIIMAENATLHINTTNLQQFAFDGSIQILQDEAYKRCALQTNGPINVLLNASISTECDIKIFDQVAGGGALVGAGTSGTNLPNIAFLSTSFTTNLQLAMDTFSTFIVYVRDYTTLRQAPSASVTFGIYPTGLPLDGFALVYPPSAPPIQNATEWLLLTMGQLSNSSYGIRSPAQVPDETIDFEIELQFYNGPIAKKSSEASGITYVLARLEPTPTHPPLVSLPPAAPLPSSPSTTPSNPPSPPSATPRAPTTLECRPPAPSSQFTCINGTWYASGPVQSNTTIVIGSPTVVPGNFTAPTIVFSSTGGSLTVSGCLNVTTGTITIDLTEGTPKDAPGSVRVSQNATCENSLLDVAVDVKKPEASCKKVDSKVDSSSSRQTLLVLFNTDTSSCNTKWIILGAVLGSVVVLTAVAAVVIHVILKNRVEKKSFNALQG